MFLHDPNIIEFYIESFSFSFKFRNFSLTFRLKSVKKNFKLANNDIKNDHFVYGLLNMKTIVLQRTI